MAAYYNEIDPYAAQWLRNLIKAGFIADGEVDTRSIINVNHEDLKNFTQCHFFAGIGCWSYALKCAGWDDDRPVWTGSCPCQPFSNAGKHKGVSDERHLWPTWYKLIEQSKPKVIFGEQVASKDARTWLDIVQTDLEGGSYSVAAFDLCAAGVGAPHVRSRLYWVADSNSKRFGRIDPLLRPENDGRFPTVAAPETSRCRKTSSMDAPNGEGSQGWGIGGDVADQRATGPAGMACNGFWGNADWIGCSDGKARPIEPGTFPLVDGSTKRVGRLRAYGNAIVAPLAKEFIKAYMNI
jgi:DNA (cytosine-5)-methyltransferase 1